MFKTLIPYFFETPRVIFVSPKMPLFYPKHQVHFCKKRGKNKPSCIVILSLPLIILSCLRLPFYRASRLRSNLGKNGAKTVAAGITVVVEEVERACTRTIAIEAPALEPRVIDINKARVITIPTINFG